MKVSAIVPAYNSAERLYFNLLSYNNQDFPRGDYEVIVINNGSKDNILEMLAAFKPSFRLRCINLQANRGRACARNLGADYAQGDILVFNDGDMINSSGFLSSHAAEHENAGTVVCGYGWRRLYSYYYRDFSGYVRRNFINQRQLYHITDRRYHRQKMYKLIADNDIYDDAFLKYSFYLEEHHKLVREVEREYGRSLSGYSFPWRFLMTSNCSISRKDFYAAGGFDEGFKGWGCEDIDLGYRLYRRGCGFLLNGKAVSVHQEHPIDSEHDSLGNILRFVEKYDSIDLHLFYFARYSSIESSDLNKITKEAEALQDIGSYSDIAEDFLAMLKKVKNNAVYNTSPVRPGYQECGREKAEKAGQRLKELENKLEAVHFVKAYKCLWRDIFGFDIY